MFLFNDGTISKSLASLIGDKITIEVDTIYIYIYIENRVKEHHRARI